MQQCLYKLNNFFLLALSSEDSDSSSISSSTVVTSASDDEKEEDDSLSSSAFEDEDDNRKESLRKITQGLSNGGKKHATKKRVAFMLEMMLLECLTLDISFGPNNFETTR
ncbi:uncharacterized protein MONOS_8015 [Monocercomonoides exilis]|uniref:uncharacterized protein n=1 Tax=Monocercomonoides exilis TaxID=2049356 RepID=UPI00355A4691|nr:hypothetical protein MONOS_8015 [Monocercomonoides exilis]|eukprot:MONOS_8015.1-p1 / transcript=MONOS_8015.1 / gene=MONOS_8015 / organism=Monocercomonoides_exilis_PA203 / gene_product=unspecified product / transcript_product=unspecified product / location=Mono_scaffold00291:7237-7566(-) / protein_length=110 / sequence_SO=supercontig / SO=protein_coding / is_pseudo=false